MIHVVNKKTYRGTGEYIGRPSPLGNPFTHLRHVAAKHGLTLTASRQRAVERFHAWICTLPDEHPAMQEMERLYHLWRTRGELTLICWCAPEACHGHVIKHLFEARAHRESSERPSP